MSFHTDIIEDKGFRISIVQAIIILGLFLRIVVAAWNGFFGPSFGAECDASTLHKAAVDFAFNPSFQGFNSRTVYTYFLGSFYYLTSDSLFLGSLLSCLVWFGSAWVLLKIMQLLSFESENKNIAMLIYALLPSAILFTSVTLRESYQLLFVNLAIYAALKIFLNRSQIYWLLLLFAVTCGGILHGTLFVFGLATVVATLIWLVFRDGKKILSLRLLYIFPVVALVLYGGFYFFTSATNYSLGNGIIDAIVSYQRGGLSYLDQGRAFYRTSIEINGIFDFILFIPVALAQYLFEPMPWRVGTLADIELLIENSVRVWLLWNTWVGFRGMSARRRRPVLFIFLLYIVIETIWALGTLNWGTAVRHHIPAMGMLLIIAFAYSPGRSDRIWQRWFSWVQKKTHIRETAGAGS